MDLDEYHYNKERSAAHHRRGNKERCPICDWFECNCQKEIEDYDEM